jgi:hypothetical protein
MRRLSTALLLTFLAQPALAQATGDQPVITLGITGGWVVGGDLWQIPNQPYPAANAPVVDTLNLARSLKPGFTFGLTSTYYPNNHLGLTGEIALLGLGTEATCSAKVPSGSTETTDVCTSLGQSNTAGTNVALSLGGVYRIASRQAISPFVSARVGILVMEQSTIDLRGYFYQQTPDGLQQVTVAIFDDPNKTRVQFYGQLAVGFSFAAGHGYRLRLEARDNYEQLPVPTGPSDPSTGAFPRSTVGKHLFSIVAGFDIVLEKKRGRRY